jgi:hypothetical protein
MAAEDMTDLIEELRAAGGDTAAVEVKSAAGGLPLSLHSLLSSLSSPGAYLGSLAAAAPIAATVATAWPASAQTSSGLIV